MSLKLTPLYSLRFRNQGSAPSPLHAIPDSGVSTTLLCMPDTPASLFVGVSPGLLLKTDMRAGVYDSQTSALCCLFGPSPGPQTPEGQRVFMTLVLTHYTHKALELRDHSFAHSLQSPSARA